MRVNWWFSPPSTVLPTPGAELSQLLTSLSALINETLLVPKQVVQLQAVTGQTQNVDRQQGGLVDADGEHLRRPAHRVPTQCARRQTQPPTQEQTRAISALLSQGM